MQIPDAGRVTLVGFPGRQVNEHVREALKMGVAGFIFFKRNVESAEQCAELIAEIRGLAGKRRLLFAVDQEGGRVERLGDFATHWPPMRTLGALPDRRLLADFARALGREVRALGFDIDFAPVMDVDSNSANPVIGDRSFSREAKRVAEAGRVVIEAMQAEGVWACAKHFPGHGDTETDSHLELPRLPHDRRRLDEIELPPFRAAVEAGVAAVMTAHVIVEPLDERTPATMSPRLLSILREEMGFTGAIISDDLEMKAVAAYAPISEAAVRAARAGCDLLLVCHELTQQEAVVRGLYDAHQRGELPVLRLHEMHRRLQAVAQRFPAPGRGDWSLVGCEEHRDLARRIAAAAEREA